MYVHPCLVGVQCVIQLGPNLISLKGPIVQEVYYEADTGMHYSWGIVCIHFHSS